VDDDDAVGREVDVKLETLGAHGEAVVERRERILGRERAAASMREYLRPARVKERMRQRRGSLHPEIESVHGCPN
jgi:hypothetical protein